MRTPLSRQRVLEAAMRYVDQHGLAALSLHKLGAELGVRAMSLYNHVDGKDGVLDGLVELLWHEMASDDEPADWRERLRQLACGVRATVARHPSAASLMMTRPVLPVGALRIAKNHLDALQEAGFSRPGAAEALRAVLWYAFGAALSERCWSCAAATAETDLARLRRVNSLLPEDVPDDLLAVAMDLCGECDVEGSFQLGLGLMLQGLEPR